MKTGSPLHEVSVEEVLHFWEPDAYFGHTIVVLRQNGGSGRIMILTDPLRTKEIITALEGKKSDRPMTLDFAKSCIVDLGGTLKFCYIENSPIKEMNYIGMSVVEQNGKEIEVSSRPSDAIATSLKSKVPLCVREECFGTLNNPLSGYAPISHLWPFRTKGYEWVREAAERRKREREAEKAAKVAV